MTRGCLCYICSRWSMTFRRELKRLRSNTKSYKPIRDRRQSQNAMIDRPPFMRGRSGRRSQFKPVGFLAGMTDDMLKSYAERVKVDTEMSKESREMR